MHNKNTSYLCFVPLLLVIGFCLKHALSAPPSDFAGYYYGGRALLTGHYQDAYDMQALNDHVVADGHKGVLVSYAPFPPFTSLVFAPFLLFPMAAAKFIFNCCCAGLFLFSLWRSYRYFLIPNWLIVALPFIFFIPLLNNLAFGQSYLLLFVLLIEGYRADREKKTVLSSVLWGIAILFKLFPAFLFVFLVLRKKFVQAFWLGVACTLLLVLSLALNGIPAWKFYISEIVPKMGQGELNDSFTYVFQSAFMLFKRAFIYDSLLNPHPLTHTPWLFALGMALFKAFILSTAALLTVREKDDFFSFGVWVAASMLISPNGSSYSLILLLLPLLAYVRSLKTLGSQGYPAPNDASPPSSAPRLVVAIVLLTAACAITVSRFGAFPLWAQFPRLYLLLLLYGLWLVGKKTWNLWLFSSLALLFMTVATLTQHSEKDPSTYLLAKEEHLYIYDYTVRDNRLVYYYRDDSGEHEQVTDYPIHTLATGDLSLSNNQIWCKGVKLTESADRKEKPALIDGEYILYLSDKNRGVDFYTLRQLRPEGKLDPEGKLRPAEKKPDAAAIPVSSR